MPDDRLVDALVGVTGVVVGCARDGSEDVLVDVVVGVAVAVAVAVTVAGILITDVEVGFEFVSVAVLVDRGLLT